MMDRILTTHTGSLPRTAKVVELLLAEDKNPGSRKAELDLAVREAFEGVVREQIECGLDIINDGEQGRTKVRSEEEAGEEGSTRKEMMAHGGSP